VGEINKGGRKDRNYEKKKQEGKYKRLLFAGEEGVD